ncbi:DUF2971 domain-containing protein [Rhodococcus wratislaviensis]|uniref:DUF2971 domain-containing protein n=1 Tax=Rhodococcus wratislaviensis NBRC 100605 TaxID=1219028 RepID=X0QB47_RHOWR|nr:DUF2971 domain-containing protein [Rhodococcus wratislaviensis]GAF48832.1 hypothetical protein RW1_060_00420 [Rhodococcus wratislaviensis NBRC 100605]
MTNIQIIDNAKVQDESKIWRYMDFPKFLDLLTTSQLAMPIASMMEDPYEGDIGTATAARRWKSQKDLGAPSYWLVADQNRQRRTAARLRDCTYISCWNAFEHESAAMWKIYGSDGGIAITSTWGRLQESLSTDMTVFGGRVHYLDYEQDPIETATHTDDFFFKRSSFDFEKEVRIISHANGSDDYLAGTSNDVTWERVAKIDLDLNVLVDQIYINPTLGGWVRESVERVIEQFGHQWDVVQSRLYTPREEHYLWTHELTDGRDSQPG